MKDQSFEFQWDVRDAGYRWIDTDSGDPKPEPGSYLTDGRPLGTAGYNVRRCNPLALYSGLFLVFSDVDPTPESVERFANKYGMLGGDGQKFITLPEHTTEKGTLMGSGERLGYWHDEILSMRQAVSVWQMARKGDVEGLSPFIEWDGRSVRYNSHPELAPGERPEVPYYQTLSLIANEELNPERFNRFRPRDVIEPALCYVQQVVNNRLKGRISPRMLWTEDGSRLCLFFVPGSLAGALWLQLARAIENDSDFRTCDECRIWFEVAPGRGRTDKTYCSDACRNRAYRRRKAARAGQNA